VLGPFFSSPSTNASGSAIIGIAPLPQWAFVGIKRGQSDPAHSGVDSSPVIPSLLPRRSTLKRHILRPVRPYLD
jgi:hypothetical protein